MSGIEARFRLAAMQVMLESIRDNRDLPGVSHRMGELKRDLSTIRRLNRPNTLTSLDDARELERISQAWELDDMGEPVLSRREASRLCIPYGSLDPDERREIESHVTHTHQFLKIIPWTRDLKRVPELAFAHHEKLDGTGYPRGLKGDEIPYGARIMTIADIFDALTAGDRPYKSSLSADTALQILRREAAAGKVEHDALELFAARRLWLGVV
jgi:response regulator RpfG family c-di-GMP phosphodiesterase